ncbi:MAG: tetratricopeptide repeat protein [Kiritimatiellae bacterium]|nr:tetratricopeptide repeat protein [Kiritimatiellia bacterium]MDW8458282.1 tetratricopeptide repeat protein [Verrucomicrobiota bacterium]
MTPARARFAAGLVAVVAFAAYASGLFHGFVYDDHGALVENRFWDSPDAWRQTLTLRTMFDPRVLDGQRPTLLLSILLDRALGAREAWRYRLTNLIVHAASAALLFAWLRGVLHRQGDARADARAFAAALLFAVHPLASEGVQSPAFREDALALFGMLAALASGGIRQAGIRVALQMASLVFALGAKESAAALPFLAALVWWLFPSERPSRGRMAAEFAVALALAAAWFATAYAYRPAQATGTEWNGLSLRWPQNLLTAPDLFLRYLGLMAVPWPLCVDRVIEPVAAIMSPRFLMAVGVAVAWASAAVAMRRRVPLAALGMGWIALQFGPVSNLVPLFNPFAERYAYAMIPGFAMLAASLPLSRSWVRVGLTLLAVTFLALLQLRLQDWRDDETLWRATLRVEPRSARAHTWLGLAALERGDLESAALWFARADLLNPQDVTALINLAILDGRRGDLDSASARLEEAVRRRPGKSEAWANLAVVRELQGRPAAAQQARERAQALDLLRRYAP